jgi:hypothetical protein
MRFLISSKVLLVLLLAAQVDLIASMGDWIDVEANQQNSKTMQTVMQTTTSAKPLIAQAQLENLDIFSGTHFAKEQQVNQY